MKKVRPQDILLADLYSRAAGTALIQEEIAEYCGITRQALSLIEITVLNKTCEELKPMLESQGIDHAPRNCSTDIC